MVFTDLSLENIMIQETKNREILDREYEVVFIDITSLFVFKPIQLTDTEIKPEKLYPKVS